MSEQMRRAAILAARRPVAPDTQAYERGFQSGWRAAISWCADVSYGAGVDDGFEQGLDAARAERRMDEDLIWRDGYADGLRDSAVVAKLKRELGR